MDNFDEEKETEAVLEEARNEIVQLRQRARMQGARLQMFDDMMLLFRSKPDYGAEGMSPDVVSRIEKHMYRLSSKKSNEKQS